MRTALLTLALTLPLVRAWADEGKTPVAIGTVVPDFTARDVDGREFRLSSMRSATRADALAAVLAAAKGRAATTPAETDALEGLAAVRDASGAGVVERKQAFVRSAAKPWGLLPTAKDVAGLSTLGDVAAWIEKASATTIVFLIWSPTCPFVKAVEERLQSVVSEAGARLVAVSSNVRVKDEDVRSYVATRRPPYRILIDPKQEVCDLLGGRHTPEAIVVDTKGVLRFRGAVDDDPLEEKAVANRVHWLLDALVAVRDGREVVRTTTPSVGCPVRRN